MRVLQQIADSLNISYEWNSLELIFKVHLLSYYNSIEY